MKILILVTFLLFSNLEASEKEAIKLINSLGQNLQSELKNGLKSSTLNALKVCNIEAKSIEKKYQTGKIKVGRVSQKNRNPSNKPQKWMLETIARYHSKKTNKKFEVVNLGQGKKGILKPIKTMPVCLRCHGKNVPSVLSEEIQRLYPNDKAIGYKVGEIRGFFWATY